MEGQKYQFFEDVCWYDRGRCSDNFNHKKVIIRGYRYEFSQLTKMKQELQGYNKTSDKLEFGRSTLKIMWQFLQENFVDFSTKSWLCFAEKFNDFLKKI